MEQTKQYEYVDLGLPSGLKWGKCNVGAETETDYGYYFQWGDIEDKTNSDCRWESYKHCNGSHNKLTKYCVDNKYGSFGTVDNKTTLDLKDDAATQIMGGDWRMPTKGDFQELLDNTDSEWIEDFNGSGVNGWKFISKTDASKYVFFPANGHAYGMGVDNRGSFGGYWSSSLDINYPDSSEYLHFGTKYIYPQVSNSRYHGFGIRSVMD